MSEDPEDAIDRLIDETARDLTSGSPSSALRSRVHARIARDARSDRLTLRAIWRPVLATAAVAALAFLVMRPTQPDATVPAPSSQPDRAETVESPQTAAAEPAPHRVEQRQAPRISAQNDRVATPADPLPAIEPIAIAPMASIERAVFERIPEPMPVRIDPLRVEPLVFQ